LKKRPERNAGDWLPALLLKESQIIVLALVQAKADVNAKPTEGTARDLSTDLYQDRELHCAPDVCILFAAARLFIFDDFHS
jgi:hypothetical protein